MPYCMLQLELSIDQTAIYYIHTTMAHHHCESLGEYFEENNVGLAQDCSNSIAYVLELLQSCTKPSI